MKLLLVIVISIFISVVSFSLMSFADASDNSPILIVDPDNNSAGEDITVIGTGFPPLTKITELTIDHAPIVPLYELPLTDESGSFRIVGTVPSIKVGGQQFTAGAGEIQVSIPFTVVGGGCCSSTMADILSQIGDFYTIVWTFDAYKQEWQVYDTTQGAPNDIIFPRARQGYWIKVIEDCVLVTFATEYHLKKGWNLIGWVG